MTCVHLRKLYQLCQDNKLRLSGADLIHIICEECGEKEVCPSVLTDEYDKKQDPDVDAAPSGGDAQART
jgi:hypothetical protein